MSFRADRLIVFLTALGCVTFAHAAQSQGYGYTSPPSSKSDPTELARSVAAANRRFENAFNSGDAASAAREFYARDARILPPGSETVQGGEKIAAYWAAAATAPQTGVRRVQLSTIDLQLVGDAACEIGRATLTLANGQRVTPRYLIVWKKEDGEWRRYLDIWNMDTNAAKTSITDANIVYILDRANAADSARGRLAATKGTSADVKQFGRLMAGEHHALRAEGVQLAKQLGVTQQAPAGDKSVSEASAEISRLKAMPRGKSWDKSYIAYEVNYHQGILQGAGGLLDAAQNQQLKDLLKQSGAVVQKHLDVAKTIQQKLGS